MIIDAWDNGLNEFYISGKGFLYENIMEIKIHRIENPKGENHYKLIASQAKLLWESSGLGFYTWEVEKEAYDLFGPDVTKEYLANNPFGWKKKTQKIRNDSQVFIDHSRIEELRSLSTDKFDFTKLIKLCEEINDNFAQGNYYAVGALCRTIIHHTPPVFEKENFGQVVNNYGSPGRARSFKRNMQNLENSMKHIADMFLHSHITRKETLPNATQVNFNSDLDLLLEEIVRICSK